MSTSFRVAMIAMPLFVSATASAAPIAPDPFSGYGFDANYCDQNGLWNESADDSSPGAGLDWYSTPISAPGNPWQQVSIEASSGTFEGNGNECAGYGSTGSPWDSLTLDTYGSITPVSYSPFGGFTGENGSSAMWRAGNLRIHKHEYWGAADEDNYRDGVSLSERGQALIIDVTITNMGCEDEKVYFMHGVDPDQDVVTASEYRTCNDTTPSENLVFSEGLNTGIVTGYGRCDEERQLVGHTTWDTDATGAAFSDEGYTYNDYTQHINHFDVVPALESVTFTFIFVSAASKEGAVASYYKARAEVCCDEDGEDYERDLKYVSSLGDCGDSRGDETAESETSAREAEWVSPNVR